MPPTSPGVPVPAATTIASAVISFDVGAALFALVRIGEFDRGARAVQTHRRDLRCMPELHAVSSSTCFSCLVKSGQFAVRSSGSSTPPANSG